MQDTKIANYELISSKISSFFPQALEQYHRLIIVTVRNNYQIDFQQVAEFILITHYSTPTDMILPLSKPISLQFLNPVNLPTFQKPFLPVTWAQ